MGRIDWPGGPFAEARPTVVGGACRARPRPPWAWRERQAARAGAPWPFPRIRNTHCAGASQGSERGKLPAPAGNPEQAAGPSPT